MSSQQNNREFSSTKRRRRIQPRTLWLTGLVALAGMGAFAGWGILERQGARADLRSATERLAIPSVVLTQPTKGQATEAVVLPGNVQAYEEAPIYARTNGYVKAWYTDIGTSVKKGQLLAEIDTPEVDDQLRQAEADLRTAAANEHLARTTAARWQALLATDSVSRQETDEKLAYAAAKGAQLASFNANVARLRQLESFKRVVAPFDGVVIARKVDTGALINAGSGVGPELFRVADTARLRVFLQVPQNLAPQISIGMDAELSFSEFPGRSYLAKLVRTASAIDPSSRSMTAELQIDNTQYHLLPGGYTEAHLKVVVPSERVTLPVNTLLFRADGLRVAKVGADSKVVLVPIVMGRDFGTRVEVVDGVGAEDSVIVNPPDSLLEGQVVRVVTKPTNPPPTSPPPASSPQGVAK